MASRKNLKSMLYSTFFFKTVFVMSLFLWEFNGTSMPTTSRKEGLIKGLLGDQPLVFRTCFSPKNSSNLTQATHSNQARKTVQEVPRGERTSEKLEVSPTDVGGREVRNLQKRCILVLEAIL